MHAWTSFEVVHNTYAIHAPVTILHIFQLSQINRCLWCLSTQTYNSCMLIKIIYSQQSLTMMFVKDVTFVQPWANYNTYCSWCPTSAILISSLKNSWHRVAFIKVMPFSLSLTMIFVTANMNNKKKPTLFMMSYVSTTFKNSSKNNRHRLVSYIKIMLFSLVHAEVTLEKCLLLRLLSSSCFLVEFRHNKNKMKVNIIMPRCTI